MPKAPIIGITGRARTGKDTVANFIIAAIGGYRYSFADPLRAMLKPLGIDLDDPYWQARKEEVIPAIGVSPRRLLQTLGTEWGRDIINPNLWLILAKQRLLQHGPGMVIPDIRFENEAAWVREQGGVIIHLARSGVKRVEAHVSETGIALKDTDATLFNNGTLEELQTAIRRLFYVE